MVVLEGDGRVSGRWTRRREGRTRAKKMCERRWVGLESNKVHCTDRRSTSLAATAVTVAAVEHLETEEMERWVEEKLEEAVVPTAVVEAGEEKSGGGR